MSATCFCVSSLRPPRPKRSSIMRFSRGFSLFMAIFSNSLSTSSSISRQTRSLSVPSMSESSSSLPSQSIFSGSSSETSIFSLLLRRRCINISFSMQREAYVASFIFFPASNVFTAFISPIAPIDIRSSIFTPVFSNLRAMYTTSLRLRSISTRRMLSSPAASAPMHSASSCLLSGGGSASPEFT